MMEEENAVAAMQDAPVEAVEETASPLAEVHQMVTEAEAAIASGEKTLNEVVDGLVALLQSMKEGEPEMLGGLVEDEGFSLPDEEE